MLTGRITDQWDTPVEGALVEVKDAAFQTRFSAISGKNGEFSLETDGKRYPFLTAVKDYARENLEYWCQELDTGKDLSLDIRIGKLELYGLHAFCVKGGAQPLMIYVRPMSLVKFLEGQVDIAPEIGRIEVKLDGQTVPVLKVNPVKELAADREMTACLIQVEWDREPWNKLEVSMWDTEGNFGMAGMFNGE